MTVAEMIKETRTSANMTQEEYGAKLGVSRQTVSSWENGRSFPDLQMLIDICNIYHISLDKLLNEDNHFVNKLDFYRRISKIIKLVSICTIIGILILGIVFARWKIIATDKNETFANKTESYGFVLEDGIYCMNEDDVFYEIPNQKLPFLKTDFFVKKTFASFEINGTEINIDAYNNENVVNITFNHNRSLKGNWTKTGELTIIESDLNDKEIAMLHKNEQRIRTISEHLLNIHSSVYSY